ncbi:MAG: CBS domain-containing protein [Elusimicrobia bacterium]|nr:CBS domain-containing protein [Elusimicrobiota bacterium]
MRVRHIMTKGADYVAPSCGLREAARKMKQHNVGTLPVCEKDVLVGIITDRDIVVRALSEDAELDDVRVGQIMTTNPTRCYQEAEIGGVARIMEERKIRRMPVVDRDERLVGVLSVDDFTQRDASSGFAAEILRATAAHHI